MIKMKVNETKTLCISNYNFEPNYSNKHQKIVIVSSFLNKKKKVFNSNFVIGSKTSASLCNATTHHSKLKQNRERQ
jgi:hypothetical protein